MESSAVNIKAFLERQTGHGGNKAEIRRFVLDQEVSTNYEYLVNKIAAIYPSLAEQNFRVYWKDEEGDMVAISSDEELIQALQYGRPTGLLKLHLVNDSPSVPPNSNTGGNAPHVEHPGVVCDGCDAPVRGLRFKCLVCADYDLCAPCCDKGLHNHHYMLRLASPAAEWAGCGRRGGPGRPGAWWWPGAGAQPSWGNGPQAMRRFWRNLMRNQHAQEQGQGDQPTPAAAPNGQTAGDAEERDHLQHVGEQVAAVLEPLGIAVDVSVEDRPRGQRGCGKGNGGRRLGGKEGRCARNNRCKPDENCIRKGAASCANGNRCKPADDCPARDVSMDTDQPQTADADKSVKSDQSQSSAASSSQSSSTVQSQLSVAPDATAPEEPSVSEEPQAGDAEMEDASWIKLDAKSTDERSDAPEKPAVMPALRIYPSLSTSQSFTTAEPAPAGESELDVKVAEAIEQMRAMGFHNEGGWMTALLYENNADVSKVIDSVLRTAQGGSQ